MIDTIYGPRPLLETVVAPKINPNGQHPQPGPTEAEQPEPEPTTGERVTKLALIGLMTAGVLYFGHRQPRHSMSALDYVTLSFAVIRLGRLTAHDLVAEPIRAPVAHVEKHPYSGETTEPKFQAGPFRSLGQLVTCPICAGTWWAAALSFALTVPALEGPARLFIRVQAAIGAGELIHELIELCCWGAAVARRHAG